MTPNLWCLRIITKFFMGHVPSSLGPPDFN
jgi:hypothetical protein